MPRLNDNEQMPRQDDEEARRLEEARRSVFALPDLARIDEVSAKADSIVDALTTEFQIEEVSAPVSARVTTAAGKAAANAADTAKIPAPKPQASEMERRGDSRAEETAAMPAANAADDEARTPDGDARADEGIADEFDDGRDDLEDTDVMELLEDEGDDKDTPLERAPRRRKRISKGKAAVALLMLMVLVALGAGAAFAWDRWYRYDDAADIQGEWQVANTQRTMVIDATRLKIATDVAYQYTLDPKEKTISYSFGDASGTATYRFSPDRSTLIVDENMDTDWLVALHLKTDPALQSDSVPEGVSKLVRISDNVMADPHSLGKEGDDGTQEAESEEGQPEVNDPFYVGGYVEYTQTQAVKPTSKDDDDDESDESDEADDSSDVYKDPSAVYTDEQTGVNYYYDESLQVYYDAYGNYYYDMYGQVPCESPWAADSAGSTYYDDGSAGYDAGSYYSDGTSYDQGYSDQGYYDQGYYGDAYY